MRRFWVLALALVLLIGGSSYVAWRVLGWQRFGQWFLAVSVIGVLVALVLRERGQGAMPSVWSVVATAVGGASWPWAWLFFNAPWWGRILATAFIVGPTWSIANATYRADLRRAQHRRDLAATAISGLVLRNAVAVPRFAFYLRPFATTEHLPAQPLSPEYSSDLPVHLDLEALLTRALRPVCPLIALGRAEEVAEGAGRIRVKDDDWQRVMHALAEKADLIAMVPLARPGTTLELQWLVRQGLLAKTLFAMPERAEETPSGVVSTTETDRLFDAGIKRYNADEHLLNLPAEWSAATAAAASFGLELPPLAVAGALFTVDQATLRVARIVPLPLSALARRTRYIRAAIAELGLIDEKHGSSGDFMDALESAVWYQGKTLQYALVLAADAYLVWGDFARCEAILSRARTAGRSDVADEYIVSLPEVAREYLKHGDRTTAERYLGAAERLTSDPEENERIAQVRKELAS